MGERDNVAHSALPGMVGGGGYPVIGLSVTLASYYPSYSHPSALGGPSPGWLTVLVNGAAVHSGACRSPRLRTEETHG